MMKRLIYQLLVISSAFLSISAANDFNSVKTYEVNFTGTNCTINGETNFKDQVIGNKTDLKYTIKVTDDYLLTKDDIECDVAFNYANGIISFPNPITQNITISATATTTHKSEYDFSFTGTDCTINGSDNYTCTIPYAKQNIRFTIVPKDDKKISSITVDKGESIVEIDKTTNIVTIIKMTEDVEISATALGNDEISFSGVNCKAKGHDQDSDLFTFTGFLGEEYEFTLLPDDSFTLPSDVIVTIDGEPATKGIDYEYSLNDDKTYKLSFELKGGTMIQAIAINSFSTVTFNSNGGSLVDPIENIEPGETINAPIDPTKDRYIFDGWYRDNDTFEYKFNFQETPISSNLTLYAKWIEIKNTVTVTLDAGRSSFIETTSGDRYYSFQVEKGAKWGDLDQSLIAGARPNNDFCYWSLNGEIISEDAVIDESIELEANYTSTSTEYLTFTPRQDEAILKITKQDKNLSYKTTEAPTWVDITESTCEITVNRGNQIFLKGNNTMSSIKQNAIFNTDESYFEVSGLCNSLFNNNLPDYAFYNLFLSFEHLKSAYNLLLPNVTLASHCYTSMFQGCTSLVNAPELPATKLADSCYYGMFQGCTSLVTAPNLPATTLASECCNSMFQDCGSLINAPHELPATVLTENCYDEMFSGCSSLVRAPELPATTLADSCYSYMFTRCSKLVNVPNLPATTLAPYCYFHMFDECTLLEAVPTLPATTLPEKCYTSMFQGCASLVTAPNLLATTLAPYCYSSMFEGCSSLVTAPNLPVTTLEGNCYSYMFQHCTSLVTAPNLPATTLAEKCYAYMFDGCSSLVNAPELPATTLANSCCQYMFYDCTSLVTAPNLPASKLKERCYFNMFGGCSSLNVNDNGGGTIIFKCPLEIPYQAVDDMFFGTGGTFQSTPIADHRYYYN